MRPDTDTRNPLTVAGRHPSCLLRPTRRGVALLGAWTMIDFAAFLTTREDSRLICSIVARAGVSDRLSLAMDIEAVHNCGYPLDLRALLDAGAEDFTHDITGIRRYLDRDTGKLRDCFVPRFARQKRE